MAQLGGKAEIAINGTLIPASILSEVAVEISEGTRERDTLGGKFTRPSGSLEKAEVKFTLFPPSLDFLKHIFPERYNAPTGAQTAGNIIINADETAEVVAGAVNIHYTAEQNDANDVYIYNGLALLNFNGTYTSGDDLTVEIVIYAQPDEDGNVARLGTGDTTAVSVYDETTQQTVPVTS